MQACDVAHHSVNPERYSVSGHNCGACERRGRKDIKKRDGGSCPVRVASKHRGRHTGFGVAQAVVGFLGDVLAQRLERTGDAREFSAIRAVKVSSSERTCAATQPCEALRIAQPESPRRDLPVRRRRKVAGWTALFAGPFTIWFRRLDSRFPTAAAGAAPVLERLRSVLTKVALNQAIASPANNAGFYAWVIATDAVLRPPSVDGPVDGTVAAIGRKLREDLPRTMVNSVVVWGTAWTVSIMYMPPHTRALFNTVGQVRN